MENVWAGLILRNLLNRTRVASAVPVPRLLAGSGRLPAGDIMAKGRGQEYKAVTVDFRQQQVRHFSLLNQRDTCPGQPGIIGAS